MAKNKVTSARGGQFRVSLITPTRLPIFDSCSWAILMRARASMVENHNVIDACIAGILLISEDWCNSHDAKVSSSYSVVGADL
ncbi:hypothetical protein Tco_0491887 [Tanacetum coccineum]